ncbi:hypothetical protein POTOM_022007 [Populus tomentosa]|uniref:50S ribosomal protein L31 n=1 Tax=Populus tomentosa TaxID=118781 RepID=A0A8X7ZUV6_POPTO|nr:hypothetical protein POTOM_022007 [Populus tomentosa]
MIAWAKESENAAGKILLFGKSVEILIVERDNRGDSDSIAHTDVDEDIKKRDIRLEFYEDATVYCIGELVMATSGTKQEYMVDVWSGNHPFYLGNRFGVLVDADQVEKFRKKLGELSQIMGIPVLKGEFILPAREKSVAGKAGKKK